MQNTECTFVCEQYTDYKENALSSETKLKVEKHLSLCATCSDIFQELNEVINNLHHFPKVTTSPDFTNNLMSRVDDLKHETTWHKIYKSTYTRVAGYAVAAGFLVALGLNIWLDPVSTINPQKVQGFAGDQNAPSPTIESLVVGADSASGGVGDTLQLQNNTIKATNQSMHLVSDSK